MPAVTARRSFFLVVLALVLGATGAGRAAPCVVTDNGSGTADLPPAGCDYTSPDEVFLILDGLPPNTTIELEPTYGNFTCLGASGHCSVVISPGVCEGAGGALGGNAHCSESTIQFQATGTGYLAGFSRVVTLALEDEVHTAPRTPGDPVQSFATELISLDGDLFGDPDFDTLRLRAGTAHGLPSPGNTTLADLGDGTFNVDSFFDVAYSIEFIGAPGSALEGMAGTTVASIRIETGEPLPVTNDCVVPDDGTGTATFPPAACRYLNPDDNHRILNGLPAGTTIELDTVHESFSCPGSALHPSCSVSLPAGQCETPGGSLAGSVACYEMTASMDVSGTGSLTGYSRSIALPLFVEAHLGPRTPGQSVQLFAAEIVQLQGQLFGDPDFDYLQISAGSAVGAGSTTGHTRLTDLGDGTFNVESFFDIGYRIDFQGSPGSVLEGFGGSTTGSVRKSTGLPIEDSPTPVPSLGGGAILVLALLLGCGGVAVVRRSLRAAG